MTTLRPIPLTKTGFAPFGSVIEAGVDSNNQMNSGAFQRFDDLAAVAVQPAADSDANNGANISIVRSVVATQLPYVFDLVECHPLCSQAFIPRTEFEFLVVVGPPGQTVEAAQLQAFVSNGTQGISYHPGTWHMPLIAQGQGQEFLVVDQATRSGNLRELVLPAPVTLLPA